MERSVNFNKKSNDVQGRGEEESEEEEEEEASKEPLESSQSKKSISIVSSQSMDDKGAELPRFMLLPTERSTFLITAALRMNEDIEDEEPTMCTKCCNKTWHYYEVCTRSKFLSPVLITLFLLSMFGVFLHSLFVKKS